MNLAPPIPRFGRGAPDERSIEVQTRELRRTANRAPAEAKRFAMAAPIPRELPVTKATLPSSALMFSDLVG